MKITSSKYFFLLLGFAYCNLAPVHAESVVSSQHIQAIQALDNLVINNEFNSHHNGHQYSLSYYEKEYILTFDKDKKAVEVKKDGNKTFIILPSSQINKNTIELYSNNLFVSLITDVQPNSLNAQKLKEIGSNILQASIDYQSSNK